MLKITIMETPTERRWVVQGCLVGPWVSELRATWKRVHRSQDKRNCVIDLNDVTFIDKSGERLLRAMSKKGAQFIAGGLYVKHVLEHLKTSGRRGLIKLIVCLFAGLQTNVYCPGNIRASAAGTYGDESERGLRVAIQCSKSVESVNLEQFECEQRRNITMPVELMDAIDGANAMSSSSPDRTARAED